MRTLLKNSGKKHFKCIKAVISTWYSYIEAKYQYFDPILFQVRTLDIARVEGSVCRGGQYRVQGLEKRTDDGINEQELYCVYLIPA